MKSCCTHYCNEASTIVMSSCCHRSFQAELPIQLGLRLHMRAPPLLSPLDHSPWHAAHESVQCHSLPNDAEAIAPGGGAPTSDVSTSSR